MEISLINVNVSDEKVTSTGFPKILLSLLFLKNNKLKIVHMPEEHISG